MRFLIVIILVLAIAGGVAWMAKRVQVGDTLVPDATLVRGNENETPAQRQVRALDAQQDAVEKYNEIQQERITAPMAQEQELLEQSQDLLERREELRTQQQTIPMEQEQELLEKQQNLLNDRQALEQRQQAIPYEQEIERIRQQKRLIEERRALEEMQQEEIPSPIPRGIRPYPLGQR